MKTQKIDKNTNFCMKLVTPCEFKGENINKLKCSLASLIPFDMNLNLDLFCHAGQEGKKHAYGVKFSVGGHKRHMLCSITDDVLDLESLLAQKMRKGHTVAELIIKRAEKIGNRIEARRINLQKYSGDLSNFYKKSPR